VWAFSAIDNDYHLDHLYRIDPKTNAVTGSVEVGYLPTALAADADGVWVANRRACDEITDCADSEHPGTVDLPGPPTQSCVTRIDPQTLQVVSVVELRSPVEVALGAGAVWVIDRPAPGKSSLVRIDPSTNAIVARVPLNGGFDTPKVSVLNGVVWVTSGQKLHRIDPASNTLTATYDIAGSLITPAPSGGGLWLAGSVGTAQAVLRIDPDSGRVTGSYPVTRGYPWAGGGHAIWSIGGFGSFREFDTERAAFGGVSYFGGDPGAYGLTTGFGSVWVAFGDGTVWRIAQ
jgi:DNA-binding beta-propeller fold protein YncE